MQEKFSALPDYKQFYSINDLITAGFGSRTTIWREIKRGELPAIKTSSGRVLISRDDLAIYQHEHKVSPSAITTS